MMSEQETPADKAAFVPECACFCMGAGPQLFELMGKVGPKAAKEHFHNARIEFLKGIRSLVDQRIEQLSKTEQKGTKVVVE